MPYYIDKNLIYLQFNFSYSCFCLFFIIIMWSKEEEIYLENLILIFGKKWSLIQKFIPQYSMIQVKSKGHYILKKY